MRLVTWNLGHRRNGNRCPDRLVAALRALEPDIVTLVDRTPGAAHQPLLEALAAIGLGHQLTTTPSANHGRSLLASRLEVAHGSLGTGTGEHMPSDVLHAYAPTGVLDVVSLRIPGSGRPPPARDACCNWLLHAAATLKHRRAILIGDFEADSTHREPGSPCQLRRFISEGWQHAVPPEGASYSTGNQDATRIDHAFLSPSLQHIGTRYALEVAGLRLAGSRDSLAEQPPLVVDLQ
jgi:endonuclease/exonuclease/phosphatase family metal-dependent hydrolase